MPLGGLALAALQASPYILQGVGGIASAVNAGNLNKQRQDLINNRPEFEIPEGHLQSEALLEQLAGQGIPAAEVNQYLNNQRASQAASLGAVENIQGPNALAAVSQISQQQQNANLQLLSQTGARRVDNIKALAAARSARANYEQQAFEFNQVAPYLAQLQGINQRIGNARGNATAGLTGAVQGLGTLAGTESFLSNLG